MRESKTKHPDHMRALSLYQRGGGPETGHGMRLWLQRAFEVSAGAVHKWALHGYPAYALRALELLELVPPKRWPEVWRIKDH